MPDFRQHIKAGFTKVRSAFLRYTEHEYAIVGEVLANMATARIHSIKPTVDSSETTLNSSKTTKNSNKTTLNSKENDGSDITNRSRSL